LKPPPQIAVLGYGNPDRGEDGVGPAVVRGLSPTLPPEVAARAINRDGLALLDLWEGCDTVILIDAVLSGAAPGTVRYLNGCRLPASDRLRLSSTHGWGLRETIELGARLGRLPRRLLVVGIEAERFEIGAAIRPAVAEGIRRATVAVGYWISHPAALETALGQLMEVTR
jgi:hydrogenase maturation protease